MKPDGYVIIAGDDQVEPVIAFVPHGNYDENSDDFINTMLKNDLSYRVLKARSRAMQSKSSSIDGLSIPSPEELERRKAKDKWAKLDIDPSILKARKSSRLNAIADVRVAPFLNIKWGQNIDGANQLTYNLFTPNNWPAGCTATAFAQLMYFFKHDSVLPTRDYTYRLKVTDDEGGVGEDSMNVLARLNKAPVVNAGADKILTPGKSILQTANASDDSDGVNDMNWKWMYDSKMLNTRTLYYKPKKAGIYILTISVTDTDGATGVDSIVLTVIDSDSSNTPPAVDAGADKTVQVGQSISISGSVTDTDGIKSYRWSQGNTVLSTSPGFTYTPTTSGRKALVLTVEDNKGVVGGDSIIVDIAPAAPKPNSAPTADAGANKTVEVNKTISITGNAADSDGTIVSYQWMEGAIVLATTQTFNYKPISTGNHTLTLNVTDNDDATGNDSMQVNVTAAVQTPEQLITPILFLLQ